MRHLLYEISHRTTYAYVAPVSFSHHLLRLRPRDLPNQVCLTHRYQIQPAPAVLAPHQDHFGNTGHFVAVEGSHEELHVESRCRVAVAPAYVPAASETPSWETAGGMCRVDHSRSGLDAIEFTYDSPNVKPDAGIQAYAAASFPAGRRLLEAVLDLTARIHDDFTFDPEATNVATPVAEVFERRCGVCQDYAHFQIACLRAIGLPARYVSGYLETDPPPGQPKLVGADASHAWVAFYCPGLGWIDVDPTNNCLPSLRHITVAWGRDYADVSPMRGVIHGGGEHTLKVGVDVIAQGPVEDLAAAGV